MKRTHDLIAGLGGKYAEYAARLLTPEEDLQKSEEDLKASLAWDTLGKIRERATKIGRELTREEIAVVHEENLKKGGLEAARETATLLGIELTNMDISRIVDGRIAHLTYDRAKEAALLLPEPMRSEHLENALADAVMHCRFEDSKMLAEALGRPLNEKELNRFLTVGLNYAWPIENLQEIASLLGRLLSAKELLQLLANSLAKLKFDQARKILPILPEADRLQASEQLLAALILRGRIEEVQLVVASLGKKLTNEQITSTILGQFESHFPEKAIRTAMLIPDKERIDALTDLLERVIGDKKIGWGMKSKVADLILQLSPP